MKNNLVRDWMTAPPITIEPKTKLPDAHRLMKTRNIRRLPVIKGSKIVGMVTLGDVRGAEPSNATSLSIWEMNYLVAKLEVREFMTKDIITIFDDQTIEEAAQLMMENRISGLPVVNRQNKLVGMITESDIFRLVVNHGWETMVPV
ncbi:MAG: CBS domain-containing protein [Ardenticatenaceae bacterium]|nr:CBS domain-containing protein [Ardenticatenaceae bacterium]